MKDTTYATMTVATWLAVGVLVSLFFLGCATLKAGDTCSGNAAYCQDKGHALACESGKYEAFNCTGPLGCQSPDGKEVLCDQDTGAVANTNCAPAYTGLAQCAQDGLSVLLCNGGVWQPLLCPAGKTCQTNATSVWCG